MNWSKYLFVVNYGKKQHDQIFYNKELQFLLQEIANRLAKLSVRGFEGDLKELLAYWLFITDYFRYVKVGSGDAILMSRRRGGLTFGFRIRDLEKIRKLRHKHQ